MSEAEQDRDDRSQEEKLAELEAMAREQDRQSEESEKRHLEQMAELLDQAVEREAEQIGDVAKAALDELERRLRDLDVLNDDDEFKRLVVSVRATGEVIVRIEIDRLRYAFGGAGAGDLLIVQRIVNGYPEHAILDENGVPGPWSAPERDN